MFSEISLNSILKDGNPQWRLKFVDHKFLMSKIQTNFEGKVYEICNSMTSFTAMAKKTSFMKGIPER